MIMGQKPHQDILTQLSAIRSAIHKVAIMEAQRYVESVMNLSNAQNNSEIDINDAIKEFMDLRLVSS